MMSAIRLLLISALTIGSLSQANACTCAFGDGPACQEAWRQSVDAVFLGRVENIESVRGTAAAPAGAMSMTRMGGLRRVTIVVEEGYRGVSAKKMVVYTAAGSAACGFEFETDERYLIFATATKDAQLTVSLCSATKPAKYAMDDLTYLRSVPSLKPTSTIQGSVWRYTHDPNFKPKFQPSLMDHYRPPEHEYMAMKPESGITVLATAEDGTEHTAIVDAEGNWRISELPPGRYTLQPKESEDAFLYPFVSNVELAPKGCAQADIRVESNGRISGMIEHHDPGTDWALVKVFVLPFPNFVLNHPVKEVMLKPTDSKFDIGPQPGRYLLGAYVVSKIGTPERYTFGYWGWTYFPGVTDAKSGEPIEVKEGKAVNNVTLRMAY